MITCELDITSTPFCDTTSLACEIELPPSGNKIGLNLLDDEYFTIPYVLATTQNSPAGDKIPTQANKNVWIIFINGEEHITSQGDLDEIHSHQTQHGKSKFNISPCISNSYQGTDLEDIWSRFDPVIPVLSHIEVPLPDKHLTPKNIGEYLKDTW